MTPVRERTQGGNTLVEFALAAVLLVTLFGGVFQFGYSFFLYNRLEAAVRSGARYGSRQVYGSSNATVPTDFRDKVRNMVVYGQPTAGSSPQIPGLTTSHVSVSMVFASNVPFIVKVAISGYTISAIFNSYTFRDKPVAEFPFAGTYAPS